MNENLQLFQALPFPAILIEPKNNDFYIKDVNEHFSRLIGKSREELLSRQYPNILVNWKSSRLNEHERLASLRKAYETGEIVKTKFFRYQHSSVNGSQEKYWQIQNVPVKDEKGEVYLILNLAIDKTTEVTQEIAKQEADRKIEENSYKEQHLIDQNPDGLYSMDIEGNFTSINAGLAKMAELPEEEMLGMNFLPFCADHDREKTREHFKQVLLGNRQHFDAKFITAKGRELILVVTLMPMRSNANISGVYGIAKDITHLRTTEQELERNQRKYEALVEEGSELTVILNFDGTYKFVSKTTISVLGNFPEYYLDKNAFDFIHPDDKDRVMAEFSFLQKRNQVKLEAYRFKDSDGNWRWLESTATNLIEDPYVKGIVVNSREVTELVERTNDIKKLYERYKLAATATEDLIYDWDLQEDKITRFYKGTEKIFGYDQKEIECKDFWKEHIHPEELEGLRAKLKNVLSDPNQDQLKAQYRIKRANGNYAHIIDRGHIVRNPEGKPVRLIGATSDVSGIVNNRQALKVSNKRFSYAMRATKEIIWDWDISNQRIKRSRSFKRIFGYQVSKVPSVEQFWFSKIIDKDRERVTHSIAAALADKSMKKWKCEYAVLKSDGSKAYVIDRAFILRDREGNAIRMVGAVLDVTESKRLLEEVKKQNKILRDVAWEQSHVVRAPLARLKGLLNLLVQDSYADWSRDELLKLINDSADELDEVIQNIIRKTEEIGVEES